MTRKNTSPRAAALAEHHRDAYGPQLPGGTYRAKDRQYEVLAAWSDARTGVPYTRVRWWGRGEPVTEQRASWDPSRGEVLCQPALRHWPRSRDRNVQRARDEVTARFDRSRTASV